MVELVFDKIQILRMTIARQTRIRKFVEDLKLQILSKLPYQPTRPGALNGPTYYRAVRIFLVWSRLKKGPVVILHNDMIYGGKILFM